MSGGAYEYVMGNMSSTSGSYTYYASSGGSNFTYDTNNSKYITTYVYSGTNNGQIAYNRGKLGDATSEVASWYDDQALFPYSTSCWFLRGNSCNNDSISGVFSFYYNIGLGSSNRSARAALAVFSA